MEIKGGKRGWSVVLLEDQRKAQEGADVIFDNRRVNGHLPRTESLLSSIKDFKRDILIETCTAVRVWRILTLKRLQRIVEKPERDSKVK